MLKVKGGRMNKIKIEKNLHGDIFKIHF